MTCHDARERLSELLDEALDPGPRALVDAHLARCAECRVELERLHATVSVLHRIERPRAPVGFVDRVMRRARPVPWYRRVAAWLFLPLSIKLPAEAAAMVLVAGLAVYLMHRTPELRDAARMEPPAPTVSSAPPPGSPVPPPDNPSPAPAPTQAPAVTPQSSPAVTPQSPPAATLEAPPAAPQSPSPRAERASRETERARATTAPETPTDPAPAVAQPSPTASASTPADPLATPGGASPSPAAESAFKRLERSEDAQPGPPPPRLSAARRQPAPADVVGRLDVKDRNAAVASLGELLARVGGAETGRRQDGSGLVVDVLVPETRYDEFVRGLATLGSWSPASPPTAGPREAPRIRISVRITE